MDETHKFYKLRSHNASTQQQRFFFRDSRSSLSTSSSLLPLSLLFPSLSLSSLFTPLHCCLALTPRLHCFLAISCRRRCSCRRIREQESKGKGERERETEIASRVGSRLRRSLAASLAARLSLCSLARCSLLASSSAFNGCFPASLAPSLPLSLFLPFSAFRASSSCCSSPGENH